VVCFRLCLAGLEVSVGMVLVFLGGGGGVGYDGLKNI